MGVLTRPGRKYRRFKHENQYDSPILIFFIDIAISLAKVCLICALLIAAWVIGSRWVSSPPPTFQTSTELPVIAELNSNDPASDAEPTNNAASGSTEVNEAVVVSLSNKASTTDSGDQNISLTNSATTTSDNDDAAALVPTVERNKPPTITDESWILTLNPNDFIIQFGSSTDLQLFDEFVPVIDTEQPIALYSYKRTPSGRPVYGIATGVYADADRALAAVSNLSAEARAFNPWVRKISDLTADIRQFDSEARPQ